MKYADVKIGEHYESEEAGESVIAVFKDDESKEIVIKTEFDGLLIVYSDDLSIPPVIEERYTTASLDGSFSTWSPEKQKGHNLKAVFENGKLSNIRQITSR